MGFADSLFTSEVQEQAAYFGPTVFKQVISTRPIPAYSGEVSSDDSTAAPLFTSKTNDNSCSSCLTDTEGWIEVTKQSSSDKLVHPVGSTGVDQESSALTVDNDVLLATQCILGQREMIDGGKQYLVGWADTQLTDTWEDESNLSGTLLLHWLLSIPTVGKYSSYISSKGLALRPGVAYRRTRNE